MNNAKDNDARQTYSYIHSNSKYYRSEKYKFIKEAEVMSNLMITKKDLYKLRLSWDIKEYDDITYLKGWKDNCLNLLVESDILQASNTPELHDDIKTLIESLAWYNKENIEYLHKIILYKHTHINDYTIPALVLYWVWWSWKWTFISLLETIFWTNNVLWNLGQREITSNFDTYTWKNL